jgi:hypothetical protein
MQIGQSWFEDVQFAATGTSRSRSRSGELVGVIFIVCGSGGGRGVGFREGFVGVGVNASLPQLLLDAGVPEVLDLVVRSAGQLGGNLRPSEANKEGRIELVLVLGVNI